MKKESGQASHKHGGCCLPQDTDAERRRLRGFELNEDSRPFTECGG